MVNDMYERFAQSAVGAAARVAFEKGTEVGFAQGFVAGQAVGFIAGVQSVQDALSDGTRKGGLQNVVAHWKASSALGLLEMTTEC